MCGIVGVIIKGSTGLINKHETCFFDMLYADALRGFDSTGVVAVENTGAFSIMKEATEAAMFLPQLKDSQIKKDMYMRGKAYIGHNRKKTIGEINDEQAHPFVVDNSFAFVHNGTLHGHKMLAETTTDSQALAVVFKKALEDNHHKEALEEVMGRVWGAYATVMYDQKTEKVHFLRNKERPLFLIEAPDALYFASEAAMATWILCRNDYKYTDLKIEFLDEHKLATYDLQTNKLTFQELTPKKAPTPPANSPTKTGGNTAGDTAGAGNLLKAKLSTKSQFKQFKRQWYGKKVRLWIDDGLEKNFPRTMDKDGETDFHLWGKIDDCDVLHDCTIDVDVAKHGITTEDEIYEQPWIGTVNDMAWIESTGSVIFYLTNPKPVVKMLSSADPHKACTIGGRIELEKRLDKLSWAVLDREFRENQHQLMKWERDCYYNELEKKEKAVDKILKQYHKLGLEAVLDEAKKQGYELTQEIRNGRQVYINPNTNEVMYESTVSLLH